MPYCKKCGAKTSKDDNYCADCGASQSEIAEKSRSESCDIKIALVLLLALVLISPVLYLYDLTANEESAPVASKPDSGIITVTGDGNLGRLEQIKNKPFYDDPVLLYLGLTKADIIRKYGEPGINDHWGPGGEEYIYEDKGLVFIFAGLGTEVVNNIILTAESENNLLGVSVGMTAAEIREVLGAPVWEGTTETDSEYGKFSFIYYFGERKDVESEVVVQFFSQTERSPTQFALVMWKAYWW